VGRSRVGLRAFPQLDAGFRNELATWQLEDSPIVTSPRSGVTLARWLKPQPGNASGNVLDFAILEGLDHDYPNGRNYPFVAARTYWDFYLDPLANPAR